MLNECGLCTLYEIKCFVIELKTFIGIMLFALSAQATQSYGMRMGKRLSCLTTVKRLWECMMCSEVTKRKKRGRK